MGNFVPGHALENDITQNVKATTTSTTGSLTEIESGKKDGVAGEDHRLAGHIDTEGQRARGKDNLKISLSEQHLAHLTIFAIHTGMMDTNAASQGFDQSLVNLTSP
jgi:hypothetical protein